MRSKLSSGDRISGRHLALAVGMLVAALAVSACSTTSAAPAAQAQSHTPVPPAALSTVPPARPVSSPAATGSPQVEIGNFNFTPAELVVSVGSTVTWTNTDDAPHTVTSADRTLNSPSLNTDGQFSFTFTAPGTYAYFCAIHPFMTGKVVVQ